MSEGALGTRPLIPRKGLHHIVVSNCDDVEFNQVAVVLFVTLFWVCVAVFVLSGSKPVKCFSVPQCDWKIYVGQNLLHAPGGQVQLHLITTVNREH